MTTLRHKKKYQALIKERGKRRFRAQILLWLAAFLSVFYLFTFREIPVLMYHFIGTESEARENSLVVSGKTFEQHLARLQKWGYQIYSLDEFHALKTAGHFSFQKGVVITFDDGNISFPLRAAPLLQKYRAPAANFVVTGSMRKPEHGSISAQEARALARNPLVTLSSHSASHAMLMDQPDSVLRSEIFDSRRELEMMLGKDVWYFAYPGGFFDDRALQAVREAGYRLAFSTSWKRLGGRPETLHSLVRIKITEKDADPARFWFKVSGVYSLLRRIQNSF